MKEHTIYKTGIKKRYKHHNKFNLHSNQRVQIKNIKTPFSCPSGWQIFKSLSISNTGKRVKNQDMLEVQMDKAFLDWAIWQ